MPASYPQHNRGCFPRRYRIPSACVRRHGRLNRAPPRHTTKVRHILGQMASQQQRRLPNDRKGRKHPSVTFRLDATPRPTVLLWTGTPTVYFHQGCAHRRRHRLYGNKTDILQAVITHALRRPLPPRRKAWPCQTLSQLRSELTP